MRSRRASDRRAGENDKEGDENELNFTASRWRLLRFRLLLCHFHQRGDQMPAGGTQGRCGTLGAALAWRSDVSVVYVIAKVATN